MDSLSFQLREKIGVIPIGETLKRISPDLIVTFEKCNPWFSTKENLLLISMPNKDFSIQDSISVTHLEILVKNRSNPAYSLALQWLDAKMKIPKLE